MKSIKQYIQNVTLLLILIIAGITGGSSAYPVMLSGGILLIMATWQSTYEKESKLLYFFQFPVSVMFSYFGCPWLSPLCFYEFRCFGIFRVLLPTVMCMINSLFLKKYDFPHSLLMTLLVLVFSLLVFSVEMLVEKYDMSMEKMQTELENSAVNELYEKKLNKELVMKNYLADRNARLEERENISRNIHNSVGHSITAAIMTLDAADMLFDIDVEKAREKVKVSNERMRSGLASVRQAVRVLGDEEEPVSSADLKDILNEIINSFVMDTAIKASFDAGCPENIYISHEHTEFLAGALKEIMTNGVRHGGADKFYIILKCDSTHINLSVTDNGSSEFDESNRDKKIKNGFGLKKMISYSQKCGGDAVFRNDGGFYSEITLPCEKPKNS